MNKQDLDNIYNADPFPIPTFRERTEVNLSQRKLADDDRKYIVRVLITLLCTYVQRPTMKNCRAVAASLVLKYAFLKESVSKHKLQINIGYVFV